MPACGLTAKGATSSTCSALYGGLPRPGRGAEGNEKNYRALYLSIFLRTIFVFTSNKG